MTSLDATFIGIEVDDSVAGDRDLARKLEEVCPVDIYAQGEDGVLIVEVVPNGPAAGGGLQEGDIIIAADGQPVRTEQDLRRFLNSKRAGDNVTFTVQRGNSQGQAAVTLGQAP